MEQRNAVMVHTCLSLYKQVWVLTRTKVLALLLQQYVLYSYKSTNADTHQSTNTDANVQILARLCGQLTSGKVDGSQKVVEELEQQMLEERGALRRKYKDGVLLLEQKLKESNDTIKWMTR